MVKCTNLVLLYVALCSIFYYFRSLYSLYVHMYFVAYLVVGFHSHLHMSSLNINTNIHIKESARQTQVCVKGEGAFMFCKINVLNKKLFFSDFCYNILGILNLIKIIHVPQSITMRVTPLTYCVSPYFGLAYCVPPCFGLAYCEPFKKTKQPFLEISFTYRS